MSRPSVGDVMTTDVASVRQDALYREIVDILVERGVGAVPVVDGGDRVLGVVSEADLLPRVEFAEGTPAHRLFEGRRQRARREARREKAGGELALELMSAPAATVTAGTSVAGAAKLMESARVKRLPVVDDAGRLVGIVSRRDLLRVFLRSDEEIREEIVDDVLPRLLWMDPADVRVTVDDGVVTLTGEVERRSLVPVAVRLVERVYGVVGVVDRLSYRRDDSYRRHDPATGRVRRPDMSRC
jgi:CBS domain-containing protein